MNWVADHGYTDPAILPVPAVKNLVGTNVTMYLITTNVSTMWTNVSDNTPFIRGAVASVSKDPQYCRSQCLRDRRGSPELRLHADEQR